MKTRKVKKGFKKTRRGGGFLLKTDKSNLQELMEIIYSMMDDFNKTFRKKKHYQNLLNKIKDDKEELIKLKILLSDEIDEKFKECQAKPSQYHAHTDECFDEYYEILEKFKNVSFILDNIEENEIKEIKEIIGKFEKTKKMINELWTIKNKLWTNNDNINDSYKLKLIERLEGESRALNTYLPMLNLEKSNFKKRVKRLIEEFKIFEEDYFSILDKSSLQLQ